MTLRINNPQGILYFQGFSKEWWKCFINRINLIYIDSVVQCEVYDYNRKKDYSFRSLHFCPKVFKAKNCNNYLCQVIKEIVIQWGPVFVQLVLVTFNLFSLLVRWCYSHSPHPGPDAKTFFGKDYFGLWNITASYALC